MPKNFHPEDLMDPGHPFLAALVSAHGESPRLRAIKASGIFRGVGTPTNQAIREQMTLQAERYGVQPYVPPRSDSWLFNYRTSGRQMRQIDAALLAASFGLPLAAFAAEDEKFQRSVGLSLRLKERGLNAADGSFAILTALASTGDTADARLAMRPLFERGEGSEIVWDTVGTQVVAVDQYLRFEISPPTEFQNGCQIAILEQDDLGGVYCLAPSRFVRPRPCGFIGDHVILPPEAGGDVIAPGRISLGVAGHSTIAAIITSGPHLELPRTWWDLDWEPKNAKDRLATVIDQLLMRDTATWRVITQACVVH